MPSEEGKAKQDVPAEEPIRVFLGIPTYGAEVGRDTAMAIMNVISMREIAVQPCFTTTTLLGHTFNISYCSALNLREKLGLTHYVMLHSDVAPTELGWIQKMVAAMRKHKLGVLSAVSPIKNEAGETSTALDLPDGKIRRMRIDEFPAGGVYQHPDLLINTGCMAIDLKNDWCEKLFFNCYTTIRKREDGKFEAIMDPEDWAMSRMLRKLEVPYGAIRIPLTHSGHKAYVV